MHILEEWKLRDIEQKADRAYQRLYEIDSLRSDVASLEYTIREIRSQNTSFCFELQELREKINSVESRE